MSIVWSVQRCPVTTWRERGVMQDTPKIVGNLRLLPAPARALAWSEGTVWLGEHGGSRWRVEALRVTEREKPSGIVDRLRAAILRRRWAKAHRILNREATRSGAAEVFAWAQAFHEELRWVRGASADLRARAALCDDLVPPPTVEAPPKATAKVTRKSLRRQRVACDAVRRSYPDFAGMSDADIWDYLTRP